MLELCRKRAMANHLVAMQRLAPAEYAFFPRTFSLPAEQAALTADAVLRGRRQTYIVKPDAGCQGKGIRLAQGGAGGRNLLQVAAALPAGCPAVAQHYIQRPFLIDVLKFDLRIYVLVSSVDPLRVFVYREGLVRFCTAPYHRPTKDNLGCATIHLTNYAVNRLAAGFVAPECGGSGSSSSSSSTGERHQQRQQQQQHEDDHPHSHKWSLQQLRQHLQAAGHSWAPLWSSIEQLVVKSIISVAPLLRDAYRHTSAAATTGGVSTSSSSGSGGRGRSGATHSSRCFEVLGFDVLLDEQLQPWLVEVNHSPSFNVDTPLDRCGGV